MYSLGLLSLILSAASIYFLWRIGRTARREFPTKMQTASLPSAPIVISTEFCGTQARLMKWISIGEFREVLLKCGDLIVIDLRGNVFGDPFPISTVFVLPVAPNELIGVLEWIPTDRTVVFYGASDCCISMIEKGSFMRGSAPLYVLNDDFSGAKTV
ncbi:MAG: hypothetical protein WBE03_18950 [Terracidiphilus sp.]